MRGRLLLLILLVAADDDGGDDDEDDDDAVAAVAGAGVDVVARFLFVAVAAITARKLKCGNKARM